MGDSAASTEVVTSEQVVKEEAATFQSVSKHTVTSVETSHMEVSQESSVHVESVVEQTAEVSQQQQSVTHQEVSQTQSTTETAVSEAEETKAVEEPPPPPPPAAAAIEPQPVDENANSIPDEPPAVEATPASEPEPAAEPIPEPAAVAAVPEPVAEPAPEPAAEPEPAVEAAPEPVVAPAAAVDPIPEAEPKAEPAPEPVAEPEPAAAPVAETKEETTTAEEISQENIKTQLHDIINEIEQEVQPEEEVDEVKKEPEVVRVVGGQQTNPVVVVPQPFEYHGEMEEYEYYDEDGTLQHTWRPKGKYDLQKTEILYEDVVPIKVPEVAITAEVTKPGPPPPVPSDTQDNQPQMMVAHVVSNDLDGLTNGGFVPDDLFSVEIPEGIPLLARVLPKTDQGLEGDKKISLERLFTPATDSGDLTPIKKKAFASSAFYRPDHPTIDDQVELAQRISFSLVDENNKMSRGQSMYMKRKKRSMRWVHQGEEGMEDYEGPGSGYEIMEEEPGHGPEKPPMKLLMSSKGVQDFQQVQEHYENLMNQTPPNPEVSKIVSEIASPTGKGAELFAKRKKRMDKFIVDETTVQKSQQTSMTSTSSSFSSSSSSSSQNVTSGVSIGTSAVAEGAGAIYTAEVKVVQRASLPPTPSDMPHHSLLELVNEEKSDKRKSASFNLAAKGWGTYNKFYTPVTFATKS